MPETPSTVYGILGIQDVRTPLVNIPQRDIADAVDALAAAHVAAWQASESLFVEEEVTVLKEIYRLLPGGTMQQVAGDLGRAGARKILGSYEVGYDLLHFEDQIANTEIALAYMTIAQYNQEVTGVISRHANTRKKEILRHIFRNANVTWQDPIWGDVPLKRLANTDGTIYPPLEGESAGAEDSHYLVSGYAANAISDTNNPIETLAWELTEHGSGSVVVFINRAQKALVESLTSFAKIADPNVARGADAQTAYGDLPDVPGEIIGRTDSEAWISVWPEIPANYMTGVHLGRQPLKRRVDIPESMRGFRMVRKSESDQTPLISAEWRDRVGYGVGDRLAAAVLQLKAEGTYDVPNAFA